MKYSSTKNIILSVFLLLTLYAGTVSSECELIDRKTGKSFKIFNALKYKNAPDLTEYCIEPINVMYAWRFFPRGNKHGDYTLPTPQKMESALRIIKEKNILTVVDIEHWPLKSTTVQEKERSVDNYRHVISSIKAQLPNINVGYYGVVPTIDFNRAKRPESSRLYLDWVDDNSRLLPVANLVDASFPSLYTINPSLDQWISRGAAHIREANRLLPGKPVYPFIWPYYHPQGGKYTEGHFVEPEYWKSQLEMLRDNADGIVLWGGNKLVFNFDMDWWKITRKFISDNYQIKRINTHKIELDTDNG